MKRLAGERAPGRHDTRGTYASRNAAGWHLAAGAQARLAEAKTNLALARIRLRDYELLSGQNRGIAVALRDAKVELVKLARQRRRAAAPALLRPGTVTFSLLASMETSYFAPGLR